MEITIGRSHREPCQRVLRNDRKNPSVPSLCKRYSRVPSDAQTSLLRQQCLFYHKLIIDCNSPSGAVKPDERHKRGIKQDRFDTPLRSFRRQPLRDGTPRDQFGCREAGDIFGRSMPKFSSACLPSSFKRNSLTIRLIVPIVSGARPAGPSKAAQPVAMRSRSICRLLVFPKMAERIRRFDARFPASEVSA